MGRAGGGSFTCCLGLEFGFSQHFCAPHLCWARQILVHVRQGLNQGLNFLFHGLCCLKILPLECDPSTPPLFFFFVCLLSCSALQLYQSTCSCPGPGERTCPCVCLQEPGAPATFIQIWFLFGIPGALINFSRGRINRPRREFVCIPVWGDRVWICCWQQQRWLVLRGLLEVFGDIKGDTKHSAAPL